MNLLARIFSASVLFSASVANAIPLVNGTFDTGLDGWQDASETGFVEWNSGSAYLETGDGISLYSAILVQGDDGFFSFLDPILLPMNTLRVEFDLWLDGLFTDQSETGNSIFTDALSFNIYDALDPAMDLHFSDLAFGATATHFSFDIAGLAGREVAFSFELSDENDGFNTRLGIDNIALILETGPVVTVSEPGSLELGLLVFIVLIWMNRRQGYKLIKQ